MKPRERQAGYCKIHGTEHRASILHERHDEEREEEQRREAGSCVVTREALEHAGRSNYRSSDERMRLILDVT